MVEVIAVDGGNYETKVIHSRGYESFISSIGEWRQRRGNESHSDQDMEFEIVNKYDHIKGFAGPLANVESDYSGSVFGITKNHPDANTRILLAVHRNIIGNEVCLVVGQPYKSHVENEKSDIINALVGDHTVTINGVKKNFNIRDVKVGIEGAMAFISNPVEEACNVIDVGSGTVNCIHFLNKKIVDRKCDTLPFGSETSKSTVTNYEAMASGIFKSMSGVWNKSETTLLCGGSAKSILHFLRKYYPHIEEMKPMVDLGGIRVPIPSKYANAIGMYNLGMKVFD